MKCTLQDIIDWQTADDVPEYARSTVQKVTFWNIKGRQDWQPIKTKEYVMNHWYLSEYIQPFILEFEEEQDLYITGSWIRGTWRHPKYGPNDKILAAQSLNKPSISDIDFWTKYVPEDEARERIKNIAGKLNMSASWVAWPGPCINLFGKDDSTWQGCNIHNVISKDFDSRF